MRCGGQRSVRVSRCGAARCGPDSAGDTISTALLGTVPGQEQPGSPKSPRRSTWLRSVRDVLYSLRTIFSKKPVNTNCTQTGTGDRQPLHLTQARCLFQATKRVVLTAQHSSSAQPELKQLQIAQLRHDLAALQAHVGQSAREETAARQDALGAGLRLWHDEEEGRAAVLREMNSEWQARMLALHAPSCDQPDHGATEDPTPAQGAHDSVVSARTGDLPLVLPETGASRRSPTYARECLFVDQICHWVASFVRRDWALVCSTTARAVGRVMTQVYDIWSSTTALIGAFQSSGARFRMDRRYFGSEDGPLVAAREEVLNLRTKAVLVDDGANVRWCNRFVLHMQLTAHIYEEMRIRLRLIFNSLKDRATDLHKVVVTLEQTLGKYDARHASAEDSPDGTVIDDSAPQGAGS